MSSRWMRNSFIYLLIAVAVIAILFTLFSRPLGDAGEISINEVVALTARGDVSLIEVDGDRLSIDVTQERLNRVS